jgi:hypothetical protein
MASILLTAANKGFWKAPAETIRDLANTLGALVVRYGPSCSAHSCGNSQTIEWSRRWMNPVLASSYSHAMIAALRGNGYPGMQPVFSRTASVPGMSVGSRKRLFDFRIDHLPSHSTTPVTFVEAVVQRIRHQDWSSVFLSFLFILVPSGIAVFLVRDRYYRRRGSGTIQLTL